MRSALTNAVASRLPAEARNTSKFVVRITGDSDEGLRALDDFIHPERRYPVIATTSKLLTTGVDAKTTKLIVLDQLRVDDRVQADRRPWHRIHEEAGKFWFTIMDFKKATEHFADPDFDGEPEIIYEPNSHDSPIPPDTGTDGDDADITDADSHGSVKYVVSAVDMSIVAERVQYYGKDGKLITESLCDYTKSAVQVHYAGLDDFLQHWRPPAQPAVIDDCARRACYGDLRTR